MQQIIRLKLHLSSQLQEVSAKLSEEAREARVEVGILKRQQEALERLAMEARCVPTYLSMIAVAGSERGRE